MNKKYELAVNLQQDFTAEEQARGRANIGAASASDVTALQSKVSSSIAPEYTKKPYPSNSFVMHDGILYTNENAISIAEDWTPAHWTQTTVAEMMAGATKWTHRTAVVTLNGGQMQEVEILDHEYVTLVANKGSGAMPGQLTVRLHGECYVELQKASGVIVNTRIGNGNTPTTDINTGLPTIETSDLTVVIPTDDGSAAIPDEYDPSAFETDSAVKTVTMSFDKPLLTGLSYVKSLLHYLGEGRLIIMPLP